MSGLSDGVSRIWMLRVDHGLDINGFKDEFEIIDWLVRVLMSKSYSQTDKDKVRTTVEEALKHMDEPEERDDSDDEDEDQVNSDHD